MFKLEELTQKDIQKYVEDAFGANMHFQELRHHDERYPLLVQQIVDRAQGVFLWVYLAVRFLIYGLTNADRVSDLERRLNALPPELEDYFQHIFDSIEDTYKRQAYATLHICLKASEPLSLMTYWCLDQDDDDPDYAIKAQIQPLDERAIFARHRTMRKRLQGRFKGLLEVYQFPPHATYSHLNHPFFAYRVETLHRTVRDFLMSSDMQQTIQSHLSMNYDSDLLLCKAFLAQLNSLPSVSPNPNSVGVVGSPLLVDGPSILVAVDDLLHCYRDIEQRTKCLPSSMRDILDNADAAMMSFTKPGRYPFTTFLDMAVTRTALCYVLYRLKASPELLQNTTPHTLLYRALHPAKCRHGDSKVDPKMIQLLLDNGAKPNAKHNDETDWTKFAHDMIKNKILFGDDGTSMSCASEVIRLLIQHGADLRATLVVGQRLMYDESAFTERLVDVKKPIVDQLLSTPWGSRYGQEILRSEYGQDSQPVICAKAPKVCPPKAKGLTLFGRFLQGFKDLFKDD